MGFNLIGGVPSEQQALLKRRNFSIRPLSAAGQLSAWRLLVLIWPPVVAYLFTLLLLTWADFRYTSAGLMSVLYYVGLFFLLLAPVIGIGLLVAGVAHTRMEARVRWSAAVYWSWWPFWRFVLCVAAVACGTYIGNDLWSNKLLPYVRLARLQAYSNVNPHASGGRRLQDAGVVAFNSTVGVDRTRSGCLKNGATYCVAPITIGRDVVLDSGDGTWTQDLFMAGVDCCDCPGEFRCGDWSSPQPPGGLRLFNPERDSFFRLAAEDWASTLHRSVGHPLFFEWKADPLVAFNDLSRTGNHMKTMALLIGPILIVLAAVVLNGLLKLLCHIGWVVPLETALPPPGLGRAMRSHFTPHMHYDRSQGGDVDQTKYLVL